jgi:hypothetical protein
MDPRDEIRAHLKPATMVGAAILACLVLYMALVEVLKSVLKPFRGFASPTDAQPLRLAAFGLGALVVLYLLLFRTRLFGRRPGDDVPAAVGRIQRASIVVLVLGEIPAVLGLALFLLTGNAADFRALLVVSLVLTFIGFPRSSTWEEWLK